MKRWSISGVMTLTFVVAGLSMVLVGKAFAFLTGRKIDTVLFFCFVLFTVLISIGVGLVGVAADLRRMYEHESYVPRTIFSTLLSRIGRRLRGRGESKQRLT